MFTNKVNEFCDFRLILHRFKEESLITNKEKLYEFIQKFLKI
jgi:hypothetical protein